jgi:hypothetical protein
MHAENADFFLFISVFQRPKRILYGKEFGNIFLEKNLTSGDNVMKKSSSVLYVVCITSFFLIACGLLSLPITSPSASPTSAPTPQTLPEQPVREGLEDENLLVEVPAGFKIDYQAKQDNIIINEMVSESESVDD